MAMAERNSGLDWVGRVILWVIGLELLGWICQSIFDYRIGTLLRYILIRMGA